MEYLYIGLGGCFGALSRYSLSKWVGQRWPGSFPLATFFINITGSFIVGLLYILFVSWYSPQIKSILTTGFLGAYTTFSTFGYEIVTLVEKGEGKRAIIYTLLSVGIGLIAAFLGIALGLQLT
ncbi:MAG TPA: fluoride efflux transporter CrcB [Bacillota bacterium]|nr:fluoride efflux transporter CrcB [Bacillota bacterium]